MLFKVKNLGLIDEAEVKLGGITVITGKNNVGKSTIGKMLYCVNNVFLYGNIERMKIYRIERTITNHFREQGLTALMMQEIENLVEDTDIAKKIAHESNASRVGPMLKAIFIDHLGVDKEGSDLAKKVFHIVKTDEMESYSDLLAIAVAANFSGDTQNVYGETDSPTEIQLELANPKRTMEATITHDWTQTPTISGFESIALEEAIYIESPRVAQDSEKRIIGFNFNSRQRVLQMLTEESDKDYWETKEMKLELKTILDKVSSCAPGNLVKQDSFSNKLVYEEDGQRFDLVDVSNGVKTFAILKKLLNNGKLKRNGLLILDEPEIHLHPEWQLVFVEILILLQKQLNLKILINTHSVYLLMAIEDYSKMHQVEAQCNYYYIEREGNHSNCKDYTKEIGDIYQYFAKPLDTLHNEVK